MKRLKLFTIMAAAAVVSASLYSAPVFAADTNKNVNLELANVDTNASTNAIKATFKVTNNGSEAINLSDVKLRYYYTADNKKEQEFHCYNAAIANPYRAVTSNVTGKFVKMDKAMEGADTYLEIAFDKDAGTLNPGETVEIQSNFNKKDWSNYNQDNDYSFNDVDKSVVLINGKIVSGNEPTKEIVTPDKPDPDKPTSDKQAGNVEVSVSNQSSGNSVAPTFTVTNTSDSELDLSTLKLKYYYTADGDEAQTFNCYYAGTVGGDYENLTGNIVGEINKLNSTANKADCYIVVSFNGGTLAPGQAATIQTSVNKDGWKEYDQSNDYSYNEGKNVTASINNKVVWGTAPGKEDPAQQTVNSKLDKTTVDVDKATLEDVVINMELNGNTFNGIKGLIKDQDYKVDGTNASTTTGAAVKVTINKDYLATLPVGSKDLKFNFNQGNAQVLKINVTDSKKIDMQDPLITPTSGEYNKDNKADLKVEMILNGHTLTDIKNKDVVLKKGSDYTIDGEAVTFKQSYLDTLTEGQAADLTFDFSESKTQTFKINVTRNIQQGLVLNLADVTAKAGDTVTIPLTITGITADGLNGCNFKLKYDTNLFENVTVTPGDICVNPNKTLFKVVDNKNGTISIMYADSTGKELEAISKDGLFMNINLKVKDTVKNTTSRLEVTKAGTFIDKNNVKYVVNYKVGEITIAGDPIIVVKDSTLDKASADFDLTKPSDIQVGMSLNDNTLTQIQNGDKTLTENTDYTVEGSIVTIKNEYLSTLPEGSSNFTFKFNAGKDATLKVNVTKNILTEVVAGIDKIDAKAGDTIIVPVTLTGTPASGIANFGYRIKYDPSAVEVLGVEAGNVITNPDVNFVSGVYEDKKMVSVLFIDSALSDEETIKTGGVLTNIKLKIKDTAAKGVLPIEFNNDDHSFYDMDGNELKIQFANGSINVK